MTKLIKIRHALMTLKHYVSRTTAYVSLVNAGMLLFIFLSRLKELGYINFEIDKYFIPMVFISFFLLIFIGWIDIRVFKGLQEESRISFYCQPHMVELKAKIDAIYDDFIERKKNEK